MRPHTPQLAILAYDGLCAFEFGIALEVFALPRPEFDFAWYQTSVVAVDKGPMHSLGGLQISAPNELSLLEQADTIIIPGWRDRQQPPPPELLAALRAASARGARLLSICSGVFVLAHAGLLDGLAATTHWRYTTELAERFPLIQVKPEVLYVDAGNIISSAGSAAGIDACLYLVARDYGAAIANRVAQRLVMAPQRQGGQAQFIPAPMPSSKRQDLAPLLEWAYARLEQPISNKDLARQAHLSERTLLRRFHDSLGLSPAQWLLQARLGRVRSLLEESDLGLPQLAEQTGFASSETLRSAFRAELGISPRAYRQRFRAPLAAGGTISR